METMDIRDAKSRLSQLIEPKRRVKFGLLKGKLRIAPDFAAPLPHNVLAGFEGR
jgi:hypothetical protein